MTSPKKKEIVLENIECIESDNESMAKLSRYTELLKKKQKISVKCPSK